jgi:ubiquinone/menaquinone biosynthesis C-methylase UbiE
MNTEEMVKPDPAQLFSARTSSYVRFIRFVRYPQGLRAYFRHSPLLRSGLHILDAGCGTGIATLALRDALLARGFSPASVHAFDLTPAMLERFRDTLRQRDVRGVELVQADVLELGELPDTWRDYDLVLSASMLEYVPRQQFSLALRGLRSRLREGGTLVLFITRRNWITRPLIGRWWQSNLYTKRELEDALREAGFVSIRFGRFPPLYRYLAAWGRIVEAATSTASVGDGRLSRR